MITDTELNSADWWDSRYSEGTTPWDQGTVAPEIASFARAHPNHGGWAIDIGCGTGTHGRELARWGYRVVGLDLSQVALRRALTLAEAEDLGWVGVQASATDLHLLRQPFSIALDVGCFHGLTSEQQQAYAAALLRRLSVDGYFLLYAVHPRTYPEQGGPPGVEPEQIEAVFSPFLTVEWCQQGWQGERKADWWLWRLIC